MIHKFFFCVLIAPMKRQVDVYLDVFASINLFVQIDQLSIPNDLILAVKEKAKYGDVPYQKGI